MEGFRPGDEVAPGIVVQEVGALCPYECALHIAAGPGALAAELEFDALLLAHGGPMASGGREALAAFAAG